MYKRLLLLLLVVLLPSIALAQWGEDSLTERPKAYFDQTMVYTWGAAAIVTSPILDLTGCGARSIEVAAGADADYRIQSCNAKEGLGVTCAPIAGLATSDAIDAGTLLAAEFLKVSVSAGGAGGGAATVSCEDSEERKWDEVTNTWGAAWGTGGGTLIEDQADLELAVGEAMIAEDEINSEAKLRAIVGEPFCLDVEDEGVSQGIADVVDFVGAGVTCGPLVGDQVTCTIPVDVTQAELDAKSAASCFSDNQLMRSLGVDGDMDCGLVSVDDSGNMVAVSLTLLGNITTNTRVQSYTTNQLLGVLDLGCSVVTNDGASGAVEFDLPEAAAGKCITIIHAEAFAITVDPAGALACTPGVGCDTIIGETNQAGEKLIGDGVPGTTLSLVALNTNEWLVPGLGGTWLQESP